MIQFHSSTYGLPIPNIICWIRCLFPTLCFCLLCQRSVGYKYLGLFLGSLFCSIGLCAYFYTSTMLFWWLWPYSIVWNQVAWCLQLCSFDVGLSWRCGLIFGSIWTLKQFFPILWRKSVVVSWGSHRIHKLLWAAWPFS